jgi:hypothetical protein
MLGHPRSGTTTQGEGDRPQRLLQLRAVPGMLLGQTKHLFGEGSPAALSVAAEESTYLKTDQDFPAPDRGVGQLMLVAAMHAARHNPADGQAA